MLIRLITFIIRSCIHLVMPYTVIKIVFKSGHVERVAVKTWSAESTKDGSITKLNLTFAPGSHKRLINVPMNEIVLVTEIY